MNNRNHAAGNESRDLSRDKTAHQARFFTCGAITLLVVLSLAWSAVAQSEPGQTAQAGQSGSAGSTDKSGSAANPNPPEEKDWGAFKVQGSFEVGYRWVDVTETPSSAFGISSFTQTYNTFVNLQQGPRILEQNFSLRSPQNNGVLFDNLSVYSFGWGGDPETVARVRADRHKIYRFNANVRRFRNFFDFDLLGNPLNPPGSNPTIFVTFSPHRFENVRRMSDFNLTLAPQSPVSLRLGYSRVRTEGPSFSSFHEGTDILLLQNLNTTNDSYQIGVDFKFLPRTVIAYDQYLQWFKGDTAWQDGVFPFVLPDGTPSDLGLPFNTGAAQPCAAPFTGAVVNPACNVYIAYNRQNRYRTSSPVEQLSFTSNYVKNFDLNGRVLYNSSETNGNWNEFFNGLVTRTRERQFSFTGPATARRNAVTAELGATLHLRDWLRVSDTFRFYRWSIPSLFAQTEIANACPANPCTALTPLAGTVQTTESLLFNWNQKENTKSNQIELEADLTRFFGGHIGWRFRDRSIRSSLLEAEELDEEELGVEDASKNQNFDITEHSGLIGFWLRPTDSLRATLDAEITSADDFVTRVSPRQAQEVRGRVNYTPKRAMTFGTYATFWRGRNGQSDVDLTVHNTNAGFNFTVAPSQHWMLDFAYNYNDVAQNTFICFNASGVVTGGVAFVPTGADACGVLNVGATPGTVGSNPLHIRSNYESRNHFGSATVQVHPIKPVTLGLGYSIISADGDTTLLNPFMPFGPLKSNYHRPLASVEIDLSHGVALKAAWNYWDYNEKTSFFGTTAPRDFHANVETVSLRYSF